MVMPAKVQDRAAPAQRGWAAERTPTRTRTPNLEMTQPTMPKWMKRHTAANITLVTIVLVFIVWATFCGR
jgi:hypothetical protein